MNYFNLYNMKIASLYNDLTYNDNKPTITVLMESDFTKEIRIVFKEGQLMKKHQTAFPIVVEIVDGAIDFGVPGTSHSLKKGDIICLKSNIPHDLKATADSIVRLTLSKLDTTQRVAKVIN